MRTAAKLPQGLANRIFTVAIYLHIRTPTYALDWATPYEIFHTTIAKRDGALIQLKLPKLAHIRAYGCKAFVLTLEAQKKTERKQKLKPNAWIGFLVGYASTNIYRIWNPKTNKVILTRDVVFNE